jgi:BirA family biotin operon repressor/biotin-[acetyl-CoA-carboxylase] ligase
MNDLSAERLAAAAAVVGLAPIRFVAETGSTNADLRGAPLGTALVAGRQTAGRGRLGRVWEDAGDALLLSLRVGTSLPAERRALAALAAAIAVREACGEGYRIKWPNDVLDGADRKVAGILVEVDEGALIVGVGINVRGAPAAFGAGWLAQDGRPRDRAQLAAAVVANVGLWLTTLERDPTRTLDAWRANARLGVRVAVGDVSGVAVGIDDDGALVVKTEGGRRRIFAGDVRLLG